MEFSEQTNIPTLAISIDTEKAFDSLEHSAIKKAFQYFNISLLFYSWIEILLKQLKCCTINNGWVSNYFCPTRGTPQGSAISAFLFIITIELMADQIRQSSKIKGVKIGEFEYKIAQYADDLLIFLRYEEAAMLELVSILHNFMLFSGLKINYAKSCIYRMGSIKGSSCQLNLRIPFKWVYQMKVLGITIADNEITAKNLTEIMHKAKDICEDWTNRTLSLFGKILVINTFVSTQFAYKMSVMGTIPHKTENDYNKMIREFIWNKGKPKVKLKALQIHKTKGGAGLVDIRKKDTATKTQWVVRSLHDKGLANLAQHFLPVIGVQCWKANIKKSDIKKISMSSFWQDVWLAWSDATFHKPKTQKQIKDQYLWFNSWIRRRNRPFVIKAMINNEVTNIKHLLRPNAQEFLSWEEFVTERGELVDFVTYNGIIKAIPQEWKDILAGRQDIQNQNLDIKETTEKASLLSCLEFKTKISPQVYCSLSIDCTPLQKYHDKWNLTLGAQLPFEEFEQAFINIKRLANNTKLQSFQYRFLCHGIVTNKQLKKWGIIDSDRCTFCQDEYETQSHLFLKCPTVLQFYGQILVWFECLTDNEYNLDVTQLALSHSKELSTLDRVLLIAKQYVYAIRCADKELNIYNFKKHVFNLVRIEKYIAIKLNKQKGFCKQWSLLLK